jgi:hypothetical protein
MGAVLPAWGPCWGPCSCMGAVLGAVLLHGGRAGGRAPAWGPCRGPCSCMGAVLLLAERRSVTHWPLAQGARRTTSCIIRPKNPVWVTFSTISPQFPKHCFWAGPRSSPALGPAASPPPPLPPPSVLSHCHPRSRPPARPPACPPAVQGLPEGPKLAHARAVAERGLGDLEAYLPERQAQGDAGFNLTLRGATKD